MSASAVDIIPHADRAEWLQLRRSGIGGSDAAAVVGLSKYSTPLQVYYDKLGESDSDNESEAMYWGNQLEPVILKEYAERTGNTVLKPPGILRRKDAPFMLASLDGYTADGKIVEIKTAGRSDGWGEPGTDEIPENYLLQVQHYMAVTGFKEADVAVLIGGQDFRLYAVPADEDLQTLLIEREAEFWERIKAQIPPEPVSAEDFAKFLRPKPGTTITATEDVNEAVSKLKGVKKALKDYESDKETLETFIKQFMADNEVLLDAAGKVLVNWKGTKAPLKFDAKALEEAQPDIYKQYLKLGSPGRPFRVQMDKQKKEKGKP